MLFVYNHHIGCLLPYNKEKTSDADIKFLKIACVLNNVLKPSVVQKNTGIIKYATRYLSKVIWQ
jgi:hypothetical protein